MTAKVLSSSAKTDGVTYLPSWANATDPDDPILRTHGADDGSHNFSTLKKLALSGLHYLHACNTPFEPTRAMLIGTAVHQIVLGPRPGGKAVCCYPGDRRQGKVWDEFKAKNHDADILTLPEWEEAEAIAKSVLRHPVAQARLIGSRYEVPMQWEDGGIKCSTSGMDIVRLDGEELADLKTTTSVEPEAWQRQAFKMLYPQQLVFYRRGARANGMPMTRGLYLLGVETRAPFDVVELEMSEGMIDLAEKAVSLWLEKLRVFKESNQWPGYAQSSVPMAVPAWMRDDDDDEDDA